MGQYLLVEAQYQVQGLVTDSVGSPLEAAVVVLMDTENGNVLQQGITTVDGKYNMEEPAICSYIFVAWVLNLMLAPLSN